MLQGAGLAAASAEEEDGQTKEESELPPDSEFVDAAAQQQEWEDQDAEQSVLPEDDVVDATTPGHNVQVAGRRQYFRTAAPQGAAEPLAPLSATEAPDLAQRFTLVGILMGKSPRAIVRDIKSNASVILSAGQNLDEYRVEEILPDRIILEQHGQRFELRI